MKVTHYEQIEAVPVNTEGAVNCKMRCLIGPDDKAPSFSMRQFEICQAVIRPNMPTATNMKYSCWKEPAW